MNKAAVQNKSPGPSVIRFKARISEGRPKPKNTSTVQLRIPKAIGKKLCGMEKVEGTINGHPFRTALESNTSGDRWLRVNKAMREGAGAGAGDTVSLALLGPEPKPAVPTDLRSALRASAEAKTLWNDLTTDARRIWIRWIEDAKKPETRARRVTRTVEQLAEGKRRPCCVNVYAFMQQRIQA